jgi:hypothetical protein
MQFMHPGILCGHTEELQPAPTPVLLVYFSGLSRANKHRTSSCGGSLWGTHTTPHLGAQFCQVWISPPQSSSTMILDESWVLSIQPEYT